MTTPEFNVSASLLIGDRTDIQAERTQTILRGEGVNPAVTLEFWPAKGGVLCGIAEARALLTNALPETGAEVWALNEGYQMAAGEIALRIKAPYATIGLYEMTIRGMLASCSGWATAARECVDAASSIPVVATAPAHAHPHVVPLITNLGDMLAELAPERVIVCGVCTDICVMHTVADARNRDYAVDVPLDCVASFDAQAHANALAHMEKILGARLLPQSD